MTMAALGAAAVGLLAQYRGDVEDRGTVLSQLAENHAHLVEAVIAKKPGGDADLTSLGAIPLSIPELGATGELVLGRRESGGIVILSRGDQAPAPRSTPLASGSGLAEPMDRALSGETGTMTGLDFRGHMVLAAYRAIPAAGLGLVAKIDLTEVRLKFLRSGALATGAAILLVLTGSALFVRTGAGFLERLEESHSRFEALFEHSPLAIWEEDFSAVLREIRALRTSGVTDLSEHLVSHPEEVARLAGLVRILRINETGVRFFGAKSKAEVETSFPSYFDDASLGVFREKLIALGGGATAFDCEIPIVDPRVGRRLLRMSLAVAPGQESTLGRVVVSFLDVTQQRRAEAEIAAISSVYQHFQRGLPLAATFQAVAEGLASTLRFPVVAVELYHAEKGEMEIAGFAGSPRPATGSRIPIEQTISGTVALTGQAVTETRALGRSDYASELLRALKVQSFICVPMTIEGLVLGTLALADPAPRSDAATWATTLATVASTLSQEIARRQAEEGLRVSEAKYRRLHESMTDAFVRVDGRGRVLECNGAYQTMLGFSTDELRKGVYLDLIPARWHAQEAEIEATQVLTRGFSDLYEKEYRRKDGSVIPVEVSRFQVPGASGRPGTVCAIVRDLSDRRRAEERQVRTQKLEALGTLAGGIAHDFNNILLAIRGNASLVAGALDSDHPAQARVAEIERAGKKAAGIVRQILSFARPQAAGRTVAKLQPVVEQATSLLRPIVPAHIALEAECSDDAPDSLVDLDDVLRAVMNLVTNSADAIGQRSGKIEIRLDRTVVPVEPGEANPSLQPGTYASLSVTDDGVGMAPETIAKAFDPFFTMKEFGKGTGLGLSIVYGIMKSCGGAATIRSVPGEGTTVQLLFPASDQPIAPSQEPPPATGRVRAERILFVDDDEALVFLARETLGGLGYDVTAFDDPVKALVTFRQAPEAFDAVVTDLSMPRMSGFDLARGVLALRPGVPVVLTSGYIRPEDEGEAERLGVRAVILKPNTIEEMGTELDRIFRGV